MHLRRTGHLAGHRAGAMNRPAGSARHAHLTAGQVSCLTSAVYPREPAAILAHGIHPVCLSRISESKKATPVHVIGRLEASHPQLVFLDTRCNRQTSSVVNQQNRKFSIALPVLGPCRRGSAALPVAMEISGATLFGLPPFNYYEQENRSISWIRF